MFRPTDWMCPTLPQLNHLALRKWHVDRECCFLQKLHFRKEDFESDLHSCRPVDSNQIYCCVWICGESLTDLSDVRRRDGSAKICKVDSIGLLTSRFCSHIPTSTRRILGLETKIKFCCSYRLLLPAIRRSRRWISNWLLKLHCTTCIWSSTMNARESFQRSWWDLACSKTSKLTGLIWWRASVLSLHISESLASVEMITFGYLNTPTFLWQLSSCHGKFFHK